MYMYIVPIKWLPFEPWNMRWCAVIVMSPVLFVCRTNTNVNDALGDYSLTLVDSLDTLVVRLGRGRG